MSVICLTRTLLLGFTQDEKALQNVRSSGRNSFIFYTYKGCNLKSFVFCTCKSKIGNCFVFCTYNI